MEGSNKANPENLDAFLRWRKKSLKSKPNIIIEAVIDPTLIYSVSNKKLFKQLLRNGIIKQTPSTLKADDFIVDQMIKRDGRIAVISNDLFSDYPELNQLRSRCQFGFMILFGELIIHEILFVSNISKIEQGALTQTH